MLFESYSIFSRCSMLKHNMGLIVDWRCRRVLSGKCQVEVRPIICCHTCNLSLAFLVASTELFCALTTASKSCFCCCSVATSTFNIEMPFCFVFVSLNNSFNVCVMLCQVKWWHLAGALTWWLLQPGPFWAFYALLFVRCWSNLWAIWFASR